MVLNIILSQTNSQISKATIFINNQGAICLAEHLFRLSKHQILLFIVSSINMLCKYRINPKLHLIFIYNKIAKNKLTNVSVKEAIK